MAFLRWQWHDAAAAVGADCDDGCEVFAAVAVASAAMVAASDADTQTSDTNASVADAAHDDAGNVDCVVLSTFSSAQRAALAMHRCGH